MERKFPVIKSEKITFPEGTDPQEIKETFCKDCFFSVSCTGPSTTGGVTSAENAGDFLNDEYISKVANCKPELAGHPVER